MAAGKARLDKRKLEQIIRNSPGQLDDALRMTALDIVGDVVLSFGTSPAGERYGKHVASSPDYPPNVDTRTLRASIHMEARGQMEYWILDGVIYGYFLETGTARMAARPFMRPAFERARTAFAVRFKGLIK